MQISITSIQAQSSQHQSGFNCSHKFKVLGTLDDKPIDLSLITLTRMQGFKSITDTSFSAINCNQFTQLDENSSAEQRILWGKIKTAVSPLVEQQANHLEASDDLVHTSINNVDFLL